MSIEGNSNKWKEVIIDKYKVQYVLINNLNITDNSVIVNLFYEFTCYKGNESIDMYDLWDDYKNSSELANLCADKFMNNEIIGEIFDEETKVNAERINHDLKSIWELKKMKQIVVNESIPFYVNRDLEKAMKNFILPRCFSGFRYIDNHKIEKVYNGICVEVTGENYQQTEDRNFRYTIILLSRKFQPKLGVSRESVRYFPIEAAGYMELLGKKIGNTGLSCRYYLYYRNMELIKFEELTNNLKFCMIAESVLKVNLNMTIEDAKGKLKNSTEKINFSVDSFFDIFVDNYQDYSFYFLSILLRVFIQKEFEIRWVLNKNNVMEYFITGIRNTNITEVEQSLLPMTFVKSWNGNTKILTNAESIGREALNADHPFSVWFMRNSSFLNQNHKSIFKKVIEIMCRSNATDMISEINMNLKELEKRLNIDIPQDVWLKESDFLSLW